MSVLFEWQGLDFDNHVYPSKTVGDSQLTI